MGGLFEQVFKAAAAAAVAAAATTTHDGGDDQEKKPPLLHPNSCTQLRSLFSCYPPSKQGGEKFLLPGEGGQSRPNHHQWWYAKWKLSWNMYTLHSTCFCLFGTNLYAQWVIVKKNSALELSQKFIKSALLVGEARGSQIGEKISTSPPPCTVI